MHGCFFIRPAPNPVAGRLMACRNGRHVVWRDRYPADAHMPTPPRAKPAAMSVGNRRPPVAGVKPGRTN